MALACLALQRCSVSLRATTSLMRAACLYICSKPEQEMVAREARVHENLVMERAALVEKHRELTAVIEEALVVTGKEVRSPCEHGSRP
eukprot:5975001-Amphidinium_carterae.1